MGGKHINKKLKKTIANRKKKAIDKIKSDKKNKKINAISKKKGI